MGDEKYLKRMRQWAFENELLFEFDTEITCNPRFDVWCWKGVLVKRFGFFVLEHSMKEKDC